MKGSIFLQVIQEAASLRSLTPCRLFCMPTRTAEAFLIRRLQMILTGVWWNICGEWSILGRIIGSLIFGTRIFPVPLCWKCGARTQKSASVWAWHLMWRLQIMRYPACFSGIGESCQTMNTGYWIKCRKGIRAAAGLCLWRRLSAGF